MRFMMLLKADKNTEAGIPPDKEIMAAMGAYNAKLMKTGAMLGGEGLHPSAKGARVRFAKGKATVAKGPFTGTKSLVAGYWMIEAKSLEEAVEWAKQVPFDPHGASATAGGNGEIEIRQVYELSDFPPELFESEEGKAVVEQEKAWREKAKA